MCPSIATDSQYTIGLVQNTLNKAQKKEVLHTHTHLYLIVLPSTESILDLVIWI